MKHCMALIACAALGVVAFPSLTARADCWTPSTASIGVSSAHLFICPAGDGESLADAGATITVQAINCGGWVAPGIVPTDLWLIGCGGDLSFCPPSYASSNADQMTDSNGFTTMSGTIKGGGSDNGLHVVVVGSLAYGPGFPPDPICLPITVVSPDIDGDLNVGILDISLFAMSYPPNAYSWTCDFDGDAAITLLDLSLFAEHQHPCE